MRLDQAITGNCVTDDWWMHQAIRNQLLEAPKRRRQAGLTRARKGFVSGLVSDPASSKRCRMVPRARDDFCSEDHIIAKRVGCRYTLAPVFGSGEPRASKGYRRNACS